MNLVGRYDNSSIDIEGSEDSLRELSDRIHHLSGVHAFTLTDSAAQDAYPGHAKSLKLEISEDSVCIGRTGDEISVSGTKDKLAILAQNILALADQNQMQMGDQLRLHSHIEYYPGHMFLKAESIPLVVTKLEVSRVF